MTDAMAREVRISALLMLLLALPMSDFFFVPLSSNAPRQSRQLILERLRLHIGSDVAFPLWFGHSLFEHFTL